MKRRQNQPRRKWIRSQRHLKPGEKQLVVTDLIPIMKTLEEHPPPIPGFRRSRMEYIIHLILSHRLHTWAGSWSKLNMEYMTKIIPSAGSYIKWLMIHNVIERISYSAGRNSSMYRLTNLDPRVQFRNITDPQIIRKRERTQVDLRRRNSKKYPGRNKDIKRTRIDYHGALKAIEEEYAQEPKEGRRTFLLAEVERIYSGNLYITVNSTNHRLDTNYTRLPGYLMRFLSIDGLSLREIDISNSQPFFAAALFRPTPEIAEVITRYLGDSLIMFTKKLRASEREDVILYTSLVTSGKFYEYMEKQFQARDIPYENRKDFKDKMFEVFFGKLHVDRYRPGARLFKELFPTVYRIFSEIKKGNNKHSQLPNLLTRIESYVILEKVGKEFEERFPGLPFLTKHDSVQPTSIWIQDKKLSIFEVGRVMFDVIEETTGLRPSGRVKR